MVRSELAKLFQKATSSVRRVALLSIVLMYVSLGHAQNSCNASAFAAVETFNLSFTYAGGGSGSYGGPGTTTYTFSSSATGSAALHRSGANSWSGDSTVVATWHSVVANPTPPPPPPFPNNPAVIVDDGAGTSTSAYGVNHGFFLGGAILNMDPAACTYSLYVDPTWCCGTTTTTTFGGEVITGTGVLEGWQSTHPPYGSQGTIAALPLPGSGNSINGSLEFQDPPFSGFIGPGSWRSSWSIVPAGMETDRVVSTNTQTGQDIGIIVNGQAPASEWEHERFAYQGSPIDLRTNLISLSQPNGNEIVAFAEGRPPALLQDVPWSNAFDNIQVAFDDELQIPIAVWIVQGPFDRTLAQFIDNYVQAQRTFRSQRTGIRLNIDRVTDATSYVGAGVALAAANLSDCAIGTLAALHLGIGRKPGMINVYYVGSIQHGDDEGATCGGSKSIDGDILVAGTDVLVASIAGVDQYTLAHELGHTLGLAHTSELDTSTQPKYAAFFSDDYLMHPQNSSNRMTEGQTFRAIFKPGSAVNSVYHAHPAAPVRECGRSESSLACPRVCLQISGSLCSP